MLHRSNLSINKIQEKTRRTVYRLVVPANSLPRT